MAFIKVFTPKFRVSFPDVFKATQINGQGEPKFRISMIFDPATLKDDADQQEKWEAVKNAATRAAIDKWGKEPAVYKKPWKDGNDMKNRETGAIYDGHEDKIILRCATKERPGLLDANADPILEQSEFYGGCYAHASINFFAWEHPTQGKGVSAGLLNVQKLEDGDTFSGKTSATDDFAPIAGMKAEAASDNSLFE